MKKIFFCCLILVLFVPAIQPSMILAEVDGAALLEERCSGCHPASVTTSRKKTAKQWQATVSRMPHKGARLTEEEMKTLVGYLSETFKP